MRAGQLVSYTLFQQLNAAVIKAFDAIRIHSRYAVTFVAFLLMCLECVYLLKYTHL